ncbi:MAG: hypothetical protein HOW73_29820 [Polyangiaceae bacterium]|nr:hypothetical protein [Polyangiaceae bacterium]
MARHWRISSAVLIGIGALTVSLEAAAEPQGTAGFTIGAAGRGYGDDYFYEPAFHLGVRGDLMLFREDGDDFGVGPYIETLTHAFDEVQFGGGASVLFPVIDSVPLVVSVGPYGRYAPLVGLEPGIATSLFFGSRSYNFSSSYVMSLGFITEARIGLGDSRETSFVFGLQVDGGFAALPFIYAIEGAKGGSREAEKIPSR